MMEWDLYGITFLREVKGLTFCLSNVLDGRNNINVAKKQKNLFVYRKMFLYLPKLKLQ